MAETSKVYSQREELLNVVIHGVGVVGAIAGIIRLLMCRQPLNSALMMAAALFYGVSLLQMFAVSTCYHNSVAPKTRQFFRHLDHCSIYFLITGSYAPLLCMFARNITGVVIFSLLISGSVAGCAARIAGFKYLRKLEITLYIIMGWCCVSIAGNLIRGMTMPQLVLLLSGGISYTAGVVFYVKKREFCHAIWHIFVLAGAALQFFAISGVLDL